MTATSLNTTGTGTGDAGMYAYGGSVHTLSFVLWFIMESSRTYFPNASL